MEQATPPSILIVGAGAIGAFFGSALAKQGARVSVVCRSDFDEVSQHGYTITSHLLGDHIFRPHAVFRDVAQCADSPDYLLLTTKVLPGADRAALVRPAVGKSTTLVLIQNGVDIEEEMARAFADNELLSALAFIGVSRTAPGHIHHQSLGMLTLGRYPSGITTAAQNLARMFEGGGVSCQLSDNVISVRWQKAVWNAIFNPISILGGVLDTQSIMKTPENQAFIRAAMNEVCDVAGRSGYPIASEYVDKLVQATLKMGHYKTSMAQDFAANRALELEAILGNVVRTADSLRVNTPILHALYALTKMVEGARAA
jgi:2-dehydropantoate 2-reductase